MIWRIPDWSCFASVTFPNISQFVPYFFRPSDPTNSRHMTPLARARDVNRASHWLIGQPKKQTGSHWLINGKVTSAKQLQSVILPLIEQLLIFECE